MRTLALGLLISIISVNNIHAQLSIKANAYQGYEWNIFRNPEILIQRSDTLNRDQLWSNSSYNELTLNTDYIKRWGSHRLKVSGDITGNIYHQQQSAQREYYRAYLSFRTKYASRKYFEFSPSFSRKKQAAIGPGDLIFRSRFSYTQILAPVHFDFYLKKQRWLKLEASYKYKIYDTVNNEKTDYQSLGAEALFSKRWKGRVRTELEVFGQWNARNQTEIDLATESSPRSVRNRVFESYVAGTSLSFETLNKSFKVEFPISYKLFKDLPSKRLDYTQVEAGTRVIFSVGKTRVSQRVTGTLRNFSNLTVSENELLNYSYIRSTTTLSIPILNRFVYTVKGSLVQRLSNRNTIRSRAFRGYLSSYIETGISLKF